MLRLSQTAHVIRFSGKRFEAALVTVLMTMSVSLTGSAAILNAPTLPAAPEPAPVADLTAPWRLAPPTKFHAAGAVVQMGALIGLGIGWYEWQIELNKADFDFARTGSNQWRRLTTSAGHRFDDNERYLNVGHAGMGAMYYQTARVHGGGMGAAYLFNIGTSTFWETIVEHREVVSVNDQIVTGLGGAPIGEALYRIGDVFARGKPTFMNRLLMTVAAPMRVGAWAMGEGPTATGVYDARGLDATVWHRFVLSLGGVAGVGATASAMASVDNAWTTMARGDFEVIALAPLTQVLDTVAGQAAPTVRNGGPLHGGELTRLTVDYAGSRGRFRAFDMMARTTLFGRYDQSATDAPRGARAARRVLAAASAFELAYDATGGFTDFLTFVHVLGPTADFEWLRDQWGLRAEVSAYGDFSMVRPLALGVGVAPQVLDGTKSTLASQDYYYGWGGTASARLEVTHGRLRAGTAAEWNHVDSIEGLDRHQNAYLSPTGVSHDAVADDSNLTDERLKLRVFVDLPVPYLSGVSMGVAGDLIHRTGTWEAKELANSQDDRRVAMTLAYPL